MSLKNARQHIRLAIDDVLKCLAIEQQLSICAFKHLEDAMEELSKTVQEHAQEVCRLNDQCIEWRITLQAIIDRQAEEIKHLKKN